MAEISSQTYDTLKQQLHQLKLEQEGLAAHRAKQKQVETAALLQQRLQYEEQLQALRQELGNLQQRLKESVERASRIRQHAERALSQQVDKLQQSLAGVEGQHQQQLESMQATHLQQLQGIRAELELRQQQWDEEKQQLQQQQAAFMSEVEQWSQGEVEAIQAAAAARLTQEQEQVQHWKAKHADLQLQLEAAHQQAAVLQEQLQHKVQECVEGCSSNREQAASLALLQQQLQMMESKLLSQAQLMGQEQQSWQQQLAGAMQQAHAREVNLQAQHATELDAVHHRLQEVLAKKDATISTLRAELDCTLTKLQQATHEMLMGDED